MVVFVSVQHFVISIRLERPQSLRKEEGITIQGRGGDSPPASVVRRQVPSAGKQTQSHRPKDWVLHDVSEYVSWQHTAWQHASPVTITFIPTQEQISFVSYTETSASE